MIIDKVHDPRCEIPAFWVCKSDSLSFIPAVVFILHTNPPTTAPSIGNASSALTGLYAVGRGAVEPVGSALQTRGSYALHQILLKEHEHQQHGYDG